MKWVIGKICDGDIIRVNRKFYYHYGIYVGNMKVIHFASEKDDGLSNVKEIMVRIDDVEKFANKESVEKALYSFKEKLIKRKPEEIIKIASDSVGQKGYDILRNNCEHFAYRCAFKKEIKTQMDEYRKKVDGLMKK